MDLWKEFHEGESLSLYYNNILKFFKEYVCFKWLSIKQKQKPT